MKTIEIGGRHVGSGMTTFVVAEIGVNHDGSVSRALELVDAAASCRADAVKLQVFRADALMHDSGSFAAYQKRRCADRSPADMLRKYELKREEIEKVVDAIRRHGMIPLATPFSMADVTAMAELHLPAIKIASPDLVNLPLLRRAAELDRPMLLSTGAATMEEVDQAAEWLEDWGANFALLHCVSSYPTRNEDANLCWIDELARRFDAPIGYSDHTTELMSAALAVASGACIVEKHLTYDRAADGPDHAASADPKQFAEYVKWIRESERLRGTPGKRVLAAEQDVRRVSRQSLVAGRDLGAGEMLGTEDLIIQRPGTGISAAMCERVIGRRIIRPLLAGTLLQWDMISDAA
jgi:sialic acid synthase SpsE